MRSLLPALLLLLAVDWLTAQWAFAQTPAAQGAAPACAGDASGDQCRDATADSAREVAGGSNPRLKPTPLPEPPGPEEIPAAPLLPLPPLADEEALLGMEPLDQGVLQAPSPPSEPLGTDEAPPPPPAPSFDDSMLYEGLPWDFCGPRSGRTGVGGLGPAKQDEGLPVDVDADRADYDRIKDVITLDGDIVIVQGSQRMLTDQSVYDRASGDVTATGHLFVAQPGLRLTAGSGQYNLDTKVGSLSDVAYRVAGDSNLRGTAEEAKLLPRRRTRYRNVTYTTCPPGRSDWSIKASDLLLDHAEGLGTARHARIRIGDIPIFYTPWMRFPIDDRRRSGFLVPTIGSSNRTGTNITIPYYWNIAPNMDATFTPHLMSKRGLALGVEVRHLTSFQQLEVHGEVLPHDAERPDLGARGALRIEQGAFLGPGWSSSIDFNAVSDEYYLTDFGNSLAVTSLRNLTRRGDIQYLDDRMELLFRLQDFQTVDSTLPNDARPYAQLPHLKLIVNDFEWKGVEWGLGTRYDYFAHDAKVQGSRVVILPSARLPLRRSYGYLLPRFRLFYTGYALQDEDPGVPALQSHLIPSLDIDGKLIFERQASWLGRDTLQTLEPRLYYVYIPYESQTETPLFDTTFLDFSYASLFRPNRFTGYDRIGDENRLTVGLTSRTLDDRSGSELLRLSLGQVFYFDNRRVQLQGDTPDREQSSSVAGEIAATIAKDWTARASLQWNPHATDDPWEKQVLQLRYGPVRDRVLNLSYRYNLDADGDLGYEDADISFRLPVTDNFKLVGRWLYSLLNSETVEAFAGIEYGRCCWRLRLLGRHLKVTGQDEGSTSLMLQLELAGLGSIGDSIDAVLERGIYGYE